MSWLSHADYSYTEMINVSGLNLDSTDEGEDNDSEPPVEKPALKHCKRILYRE